MNGTASPEAPRMRRRIIVWSCVCAILVLAGRAEALRARIVPPIRVRITGYVGAAPEGVRPDKTWVVTHKRTRYQLQIMHMQILAPSMSVLDLYATVEPYNVAFQVTGEKRAVERFVSTPPNQQIVISALARFSGGARYLMLDTVDPAPTPAPR